MTRRQVLARYGRRGDSVRVLADKRHGYVLVYYRDLKKDEHTRTYPLTAEGKREACAWAEEYHLARTERGKAKQATHTTLRALWDAYTASPAFAADLREKTRVNYRGRWAKWERFFGRGALAEDTTLADVDRFIMAASGAGMAINQVRQVIVVARTVYRWGLTRKLVTHSDLIGYRWKKRKTGIVHEPAEYSTTEFLAILAELPPQSGLTWRAHVAFMLAAHHGPRANAARHLRWTDVVDGDIRWPAEHWKTGTEHVQPLTWDAIAALETARHWRQRTGYSGPWVLFAGGGNKKLGPALVGSARGYRRERTAKQDTPVTYQALWLALLKAEKRAGIEHLKYRALHGFRKMAGGNVADVSGDARLGMEWIGDQPSAKLMASYLKRRDPRMEKAGDASGTAK